MGDDINIDNAHMTKLEDIEVMIQEIGILERKKVDLVIQ